MFGGSKTGKLWTSTGTSFQRIRRMPTFHFRTSNSNHSYPMNSINHAVIIECLKELSNRQRQEKLWMSSGPPEVSSFVEAVEGLFTDSGLGDALSSNATGFSQGAESKLRELEKQLKKVDSHGGPMKVINDPAMPRIREMAAEILSLIENEMK
jgi:hypothetical protein